MYSCAGVRTCANYPGSYDHEFLDAQTFADIGVDFLKYDFCYKTPLANGPMLYRKMGNALRATGRDILYSACNWGSDEVGKWARAYGAHMYRSTGDIADNFQSFVNIARSQEKEFCYSGPFCFNDMDMLTVGMYGKGNVAAGGCNDTEYKTEFSLWCLFGTPLMLGGDVRNMTEATKKLVTNKELIQINQDPECRGVIPLNAWHLNVYFRHLSNNEAVLGIFNFGDSAGRTMISLADELGLDARCGCGMLLTDIHTGEEFGPYKDYYESKEIAPHDCEMYRVKFVKM